MIFIIILLLIYSFGADIPPSKVPLYTVPYPPFPTILPILKLRSASLLSEYVVHILLVLIPVYLVMVIQVVRGLEIIVNTNMVFVLVQDQDILVRD